MRKIHISLFSALVLVIVFATLFHNLKGEDDPLFDRGTITTFYAETKIGVMPEIKAETYFPEEYDTAKFSFDFSEVDVEKEGICQIPVFYDGKRTNCTISVKVTGDDRQEFETKAGMSSDTAITK